MLELVRLQRAFAAERPAPTDHRSGRGHRLAAAATLDAADHELGWGSLTCPRYSLESNGAASRRFRQMRHTDEPFGRPSPACRRYPDEAEQPAQRGRAALRVPGERGCFLYQRPGAPPQRRRRRITDRSTGLGSILRRPALPAVVLGLPLLLFVPEAAHAGNADRSPFWAHRCSPVVRQYLMDKRCIPGSGSDGWYSSNTDECLIPEKLFPTSERKISPLWDFFSGAACVMLSLPEQDPTCRSFPLVPGAAPPRLGNPPRPYRARSAMPPRSTPAACCLWTIGFMLICSTRPCANRG